MNKPTKKFRCGPIVLSVWEHNKVLEEEMVKFHSFTIDKVYKEGDDWKYTKNFAVEDLPKISRLVNDAYRDLRVTVENLAKQAGEDYENSYVANDDGDCPHA